MGQKEDNMKKEEGIIEIEKWIWRKMDWCVIEKTIVWRNEESGIERTRGETEC